MRFEETKLNVHIKEHQDISQKLWEIAFPFTSVLKELFNFVFRLQNATSSVFSTLRVFSDHNSFSLLANVWDHTFMMSIQKGGWGVLKFATCLRILLFLNNRSIVHFWDGRGRGGQKLGQFLWTS